MNWPHVFTAMITPFDSEGTIDLATAGRLALWLVEHGSDGIMVAGTTGESPTLDDEERHDLFDAVRSQVPAHIPVWVGTGCNDTRQSVAWSRQAESWGADGILVVTPYYNKPPQYALVQHFSAVARATGLPMMLYNVPGRTGTNVEPDTICRIIEQSPNLLAVKEASGNITQIGHLIAQVPSSVKVYCGDDALFYPSLALGAHGVVSVASHVAGDALAEMMAAWTNRDIHRAQELHRMLLPIFEELFRLTNPIPVKWALSQLGWPSQHVRLPLAFPEDPEVFTRLGQLLTEGLPLTRGQTRVG